MVTRDEWYDRYFEADKLAKKYSRGKYGKSPQIDPDDLIDTKDAKRWRHLLKWLWENPCPRK